MERKIEDTWAFTEKWSLRRVWLKLLCNPSPSICLAWSPCILGKNIDCDLSFAKLQLENELHHVICYLPVKVL